MVLEGVRSALHSNRQRCNVPALTWHALQQPDRGITDLFVRCPASLFTPVPMANTTEYQWALTRRTLAQVVLIW